MIEREQLAAFFMAIPTEAFDEANRIAQQQIDDKRSKTEKNRADTNKLLHQLCERIERAGINMVHTLVVSPRTKIVLFDSIGFGAKPPQNPVDAPMTIYGIDVQTDHAIPYGEVSIIYKGQKTFGPPAP